MPEELRIELASSRQNVYFPGETLFGHVYLNLPKEIKARNVTVSIFGRAKTHWTTTHSHTSNGKTTSHTTHYWTEIIYIDQKALVWDSFGDSKTLPAGQHCFPFTFQLPIHCPPTFEGHYGYIRYHLKAKIDRPWAFDDKCCIPFTIASFFDLNTVPYIKFPTKKLLQKTLGVLMFKHGNLEINTGMKKSGFVPGEAINLTLQINNMSTRNVEHIKLDLIQHMEFKADRQGISQLFRHNTTDYNDWGKFDWLLRSTATREDKQTLVKSSEKFKVKGKSQLTYSKMLIIPPTVPSLKICPIIIVSYYLKIKIIADGLLSNKLKCKLPILIGTVPVQQPPDPFVVNHPIEVTPPFPSAPPANIDSQISFIESEFGKSKKQGDDWTPDYKPKYIYYRQ